MKRPTFEQWLGKNYGLSYYEFRWKLSREEQEEVKFEYIKRYGQIRRYSNGKKQSGHN